MFDRTVHHVYSGGVDIHYYFHADQSTTTMLTQIRDQQQVILERVEQLTNQSIRREGVMTVQLDALKAEVEGIPSVVQSVVTLLNGIETRLAAVDAAEDATVQAQIDAIRSDIHNNVDTLAQAVAARTPAADEVTDTTAGAPTATEPAPGSVPLGGGNVAQPPAQPDTTSPTAPTGATDETAPSGGTGSDTGGPTGSTADASGPGAGEPTNGGSTGNPPA